MIHSGTCCGGLRDRRMMTVSAALGCICLVFLLLSCASVRWDERYSDIDQYVQKGDFQGAYAQFDISAKSLYGSGEQVLRYLDSGMLSHYADDFEKSNESLSAAEEMIYQNFSKSITQAGGSAVINDTIIDYAGDPYEDIYTNVFMALNYIHLNMLDDAFVEIRRFDNKLKSLSSQYQAEIAEMQKELPDDEYSATVNVQFHNSAFARYLSLLLYRTKGDFDSARVDRRLIDSAFQTQKSLYPFAVPSSVDEELSVSQNDARLNVIAFTGSSPIKIEEALRFLAPDGSFYFKIALPVMQERLSQIAKIEVIALSEENGDFFSFILEPIEDIARIAEDTFQFKQGQIYFKSVARSLAKSAAGAAVSAVASSGSDSSLGGLLMLLTSLTTEVSERADLRISRYFPALASVGGMTVEPGRYTIEIVYQDKHGSVIEKQKYQNFKVTEGSLNLLEVECLR